MAKVQGKKAVAARKTAAKSVTRKPTAAGKKAGAKKSKPAPPKKRAAAAGKAKTAARRPVAKPTKPARPAKVVKTAKAIKGAKPAKVVKPAAKAVKPAKTAPKAKVASAPVVKAPAKKDLKQAAVPKATVAAARPAVDDKKRTRRPRPRITSTGGPVANWLLSGEKPRPSSFIPAPPRAEAPSLIAAPPASSDRLIRPDDISHSVERTVPVRVDVEQSAGRVYLGISPEDVTLGVGEGIEWDFRYLGGADVTVEELVIEFEKPSPFSQATFKSRKPGTARPHRQMSGAVLKSAAGKTLRYAVRAMTAFKTELAVARPSITIRGE